MNTLTANDIIDMEPDRELDALVAEKVMGWSVVMDVVGGQKVGLLSGNIFSSIPSDWLDVPHYSSDISAAWKVVEKLRGKISILVEPFPDGYEAVARREADPVMSIVLAEVNAPTAPEAICKAALLAVMEKEASQ